MNRKIIENNFITAIEPDHSLKKIIGDDVDLNQLFTPEKIKACQKVIDDARDEFFANELPKIEKIRSLIGTKDIQSYGEIIEIVNDMRSQSKIFGFPFVVLTCSHIINFCEDRTKTDDVRHRIISSFVNILYIALKNKVRDEGGDLEKELARLLK